MASKLGLAGGIPERRIRPIWDAIDSRQLKNALKHCTTLLSKYPNSPYALALKALVLERMGKAEEAFSVCLSAKELLYTNDSVLIDDLTLSTLQIVFQRLDHLDMATSCYEYACGKFPNNLDLMMGLFNCYVREYSFVKQQQIAIKMYKIVGEERFLLWAVCSIQLQVLCSNGGEKLLLLAEGLLKKHIASHSLHEPEALIVYISLLEQQSKYGDALELLTGKFGSLIMAEVDRLRLQGRLLARGGDYAAAASVFQKVLELSPDDWECFHHYLGCLLEDDSSLCKGANNDSTYPLKLMHSQVSHMTDEAFGSRLSNASSLVQKLLTEASDDTVRCPYLANIETEIPASNSVEIPSMKSESAAGDRNSGGFRIQPPLQYHPPSKIVLADLNVDPPDSDGNDSVPIAAVSPACLSRVIADEICQDKLKKEVEITDTEGKQLKKLGKCRSRMGKLDCPPDCNGADAEADHNVQGVPSSREEKVSSLKTGLIHVARKMPKNAHAHFVLGLMYQRMGQPQKAILAYEKAEEILVLSEEAIDRPELLSLVQVHHAQCILLGTLEDCSSDKELDPEELENILAKLKEAVKSDVRQVSIWNALGIILLRTGRLQSAISVFSTLLDISPDDLDCLGNLGIACLQSGNLELSEKCFQDLLLKDQNHPTALINYAALILYKYGSEVAVSGAGANSLYGTSADQITAANVAKECLLAALKADSKAAHIWTNLANAYYLMSDHRSSAKCLEKAGKIEPNCLATRYAVGVHRIRDAERSQNPNEQLTWAGSEMASILREGDSTSIEPPVAWTGLAMVHRAQHEIVAGFEIEQNELVEVKEHAIYSLKQAIAEDPADPVQWHQLGLHNLCTQQFKTSQMYLKAAVARCKDCTYAWSNLGISLQLSEDSSQAEEVYKQALSLATSKQAHTIFSNLGNLYRQLKQYECAKAMYNKSLELQPGYAPALNNLGLVFVAQGKWEEAKDYFNKAIQVDPLLDAAKSNMIKASHMFNITSMS